MNESKEQKLTVISLSCISRFKSGDLRAFDELYTYFYPRLYRFVFSLTKSVEDTEDLVHEVFVKVWEHKHSLKKESSFNSYLFSIAYNSTISFLRKKNKNSRFKEFADTFQYDGDEYVDNQDIEDLEVKLNGIIEKMPPRQREIFKLKHLENYSYIEIAEMLGISVNTVENHLVKAHKFLKDNFGKSYLQISLILCLFYR